MLRILRDDVTSGWIVLTLQGHLVTEWADVLERECLELRRSGRRVTLDLSALGFIGRHGVTVLGRLQQTGVEIVGGSPLVVDMLEQEGIEVKKEIDP